MRLEDIVAEVRPREPREAQDLGFALARLWFKKLVLIQLMSSVPFLAIAIALGLWQHPFWGLMFFLWFKPLMDRWGLAYASQAMFGNPPRLSQLAARQLSGTFKYFFYGFLIDRLDMKRSMMMPVAYLEGVKGKRLRRRRKVVSEYGGDVGGVLSMWFSLFTLLLTLSVFIIFYILAPTGMEIPVLSLYFMFLDIIEGGFQEFWWYYSGIWISVLIFLSPFYICTGFVLYLNSRSHQEGWDIEIIFRKLSNRIESRAQRSAKNTAGLMALIILFLATGFGGGSLAYGQPLESGQSQYASDQKPDTPNEALKQVLSQKAFKRHEKVVRRLVNNSQKTTTPALNTTGAGINIANIFKALAIAVLLLIVVYLAYLVVTRLRDSQKYSANPSKSAKPIVPVTEQSELVTSVKTNVPEEAMAYWRQGRKLMAMSLLYRGMLDGLSKQFQLQFGTGETEYECRKHIRTLDQRSVVSYCEQLLRSWLDCRYAGRMPSQEAVVSLCRNWPFNQVQSVHDRHDKQGKHDNHGPQVQTEEAQS